MSQVWFTVKRARQIANVGLYLLARMLYTDGKVAILAYTGIYAAGIFRWDLPTLLVFAVILTPFSISGGFIGGWLDDTLGSKRSIQIAVGVTSLGMVAAVSIAHDQILFMRYDVTAAGPLWSFPYFRTLPQVTYVAITMLLAISITAAFCISRCPGPH